MTTYEQKYLKYKTKYLDLKNNKFQQNLTQMGGNAINFFDIQNLTDTPINQVQGTQIGGEDDNVQGREQQRTQQDTQQQSADQQGVQQQGGDQTIDFFEIQNLTDTPTAFNMDGGNVNTSDSSITVKGNSKKLFSDDSSDSSSSSSLGSINSSSASILSALEDDDSDLL